MRDGDSNPRRAGSLAVPLPLGQCPVRDRKRARGRIRCGWGLTEESSELSELLATADCDGGNRGSGDRVERGERGTEAR